jgi:hypothetical protein
MHHRVHQKPVNNCSDEKSLVNHMERAFSPLFYCVYHFPGALPHAGMERAFGPPDILKVVISDVNKSKSEALKARQHISLGQRPRERQNEKKQGLKARSIFSYITGDDASA